MKYLLIGFAIWAAGSYGAYKAWGTNSILPYAGITIVVFVVAVVVANRSK